MHYPSPNNSASTLNSNHYLSPASPSHNSHPQYRNHHSAPIHSPSSSTHRQGSISPPSSSNASSNTSSTLQKAISRRRASSQTVESNISSSYGSTLASSPDRQHAYLSTRHSGEGSMAGGFGHLEKDDHEFRWYHGRRYHNTPSLYMLPNDTEEVDRLHLQHYIYKMIMGNKNIHVPIPKDCGRVIDLGCGPATWTMDMATDLTSVNFHGVDISPIYPAAIHPRNCSFSRECIISGLSQPSNSFDVAYQRNVAPGFTFEYWSRSITEAFRILKPGGYFESVETDVRVHDAGPMTNACFDHMIMSMASRNIDPSVVRSLDKLMIEAGFVDVRVVEYRVPLGEYGGKLGQLWKQNMTAILETVKPHLAKAGRITDQQVEGMIREMGRETARRGDGEEEFRSFQTVYVTYGRKPL
ncbi:hypothetical protein BGZ95_005085 [Linnemannia exigua]|uniref:Methyltransferase domain-containing protein n=1 Tax=Linnemannia exigua TaxID=604196 RepID=A0AAD4D2M9_9FUNG|nr:hypothetical protein BGZ95_005085 [Linnemannia exigua]